VLTGNSAWYGGGAAYSTLNNCTLTGNSAQSGGGAAYSTLNNCTLAGNSATGGKYLPSGGGAGSCTLNNCTLTGNSAKAWGGGAVNSTLRNCMLTGNSAGSGGGAYGSTLNNCTLTGNSAWGFEFFGYYDGGGADESTLNNCIVYFNFAPEEPNYCQNKWTVLNYCCTTPMPTNGVGNITLDPQLLDAAHVAPDSPSRGAGSADYATGLDIDGETWANPPSIGCDEYHAGAVTGPLRVTLMASYTNVLVGYAVELTALIDGRASLNVWDFGDGLALTNRLHNTHAWTMLGDYEVVLRAYNESNPGGVSATVTVHVVVQPVHYVAADNVTPVPPYTSWATAATNIQAAVDAAEAASFPPGSMLVLVSNGVYATGGRTVGGVLTNRVIVNKPMTLRSVNGPQATVIEGYQVPGATNGDNAIRCVYLGQGAGLSGFTLTKGATRALDEINTPEAEMAGGGLWGEASALVSNCVFLGNWASREGGGVCGPNVHSSDDPSLTLTHCTLATNCAAFGGGVFGARLEDCELTGNVGDEGGGAYLSFLNRCKLVGNSAEGPWHNKGGGAAESTLYNCAVAGNSATRCGGGTYYGTLNNCTVTANSAAIGGGGACHGILNNCTLTGNSAGSSGGGGQYCELNNCIIYFNSAPNWANYYYEYTGPYSEVTVNYCCTTPLPSNGVGNITSAPLFVDYFGGNLRLQSNSPCINAGLNAFVPGPTDLDGLPRIVSGTVDIGAYEYQGPGSLISYSWLQQFGLPTDGSADATDPDADGHTTWQEWRCLTDPTNALSALRLLSASPNGTNATVTWQSVAGVSYFLERSTNLGSIPPFTLLAPNLPGQPGSTSFTDTNAASLAPLFYRVGVGD